MRYKITFYWLTLITIHPAHGQTNCGWEQHLDKIRVRCFENGPTGFILPENFNVSSLPNKLERLVITAPGNAVLPDFIPLPPRESLTEIFLYNFNEDPKYPRFSLNNLMGRNKFHIKILQLNRVKLLTLSDADFDGFNQLENLDIGECFLSSISKSTFNGLGTLSGGQPFDTSYLPVLKILQVTGNENLFELDWSFLQPISDSLEELTIVSNGIQAEKVSNSRNFTLQRAQKIWIAQNSNLRQLPAAIYSTFNTALPVRIWLNGMNLCPNATDCSCCNAYTWSKWLQDTQRSAPALWHIECGLPVHFQPPLDAAWMVRDLKEKCSALSADITDPLPALIF